MKMNMKYGLAALFARVYGNGVAFLKSLITRDFRDSSHDVPHEFLILWRQRV